MTSEPNTIKETLNLPRTDFPIRAGLVEKEPGILHNWDQKTIYNKLLEKQTKASKTFLLHDGPPYPNGDIHMGHALNKILKDIVVRSKTMTGHKSRFVPGWDCHGLPIEMQVIKELRKTNQEEKKQDIPWFRQRCREFALGYVENQKKEFIRLGIFADWDKPYLTLDKDYEAKVISLFGDLVENGLIYKGRKPIHWCITCETALAEAEIEYEDHKSPSIFIKFKVVNPSKKLASLITGKTSHIEKTDAQSESDVLKTLNILVWTTTPWTLPANVAIAAHPDFNYAVFKAGKDVFICVDALQDSIIKELELTETQNLGVIKGHDLAGTETTHPFFDRVSPIVNAVYVTKEDGTGFVHIAPGHGQEDFLVGLEHHLPIIMPVDDRGYFTKEAQQFEGMRVLDANKPICELMKEKGTLLKLKFLKHSYPHCWRCKQPVIFRATEQWFVAMDKPMLKGKPLNESSKAKTEDVSSKGKTLRESALNAITHCTWYPAWGQKRIFSMVENRPDWCISRQRYWGIPIPVFICAKCNHPEMGEVFNKAVVELVKKEGTLAWFSKSAEEILPDSAVCSHCGYNSFKKESDILDVWFESGSSFGAVIENHPEMELPADLYLEGSDQHRGWFHSSMLISIGSRNAPPYKAVLTHGFVVDDKGRKMSKSLGNVISPQSVIKEYGADIMRWLVAGSDFKNDIGIAKPILNQARDTFSKTRNTIRFCLSNLYDFNVEKDTIAFENREEIDKWAGIKLQRLIERVTAAYNEYEFHIITHAVHDFCAVTMSSLYLDMVKDRLYCDAAKGVCRRSTQSALYEIVDVLLRLISPILVFTTEDAYTYFNKPDKLESIHLEPFPQQVQGQIDVQLEKKWEELLKIKDVVYQQLEQLREKKAVRSFLEAKVTLTLDQEIDFKDWPSFFIVSQAAVKQGKTLSASVEPAKGEKCVRCWRIMALEEGLCERCKQAVKTKAV
ncbi:isoleucine--tRNA ligase [Thermoproteota archaeon]